MIKTAIKSARYLTQQAQHKSGIQPFLFHKWLTNLLLKCSENKDKYQIAFSWKHN